MPLMMEKPVKRPRVPPIIEIWVIVLTFASWINSSIDGIGEATYLGDEVKGGAVKVNVHHM